MKTFLLFLSGATLGGIIYLLNKDRKETEMNALNKARSEAKSEKEDKIGRSRKATKGRNLEPFSERTENLNPELEEAAVSPNRGLTNEGKTGNVD